MEPVTQGLLGAAFGQALCGKALGKRALTWGALAGMLPDVDVVMNWTRMSWDSFRPPIDSRIDAARATREGRILDWFADGLVVGRVSEDGRAVELDDLRYGFPGHPQRGFWGILVPLDAHGQPSGAATRFNRPLPEAPGRLLARLLREAWLN